MDPTVVYIAGFALLTVLAEVFITYARYASVLRWLTLSLFAYVGTVFVVGVPWLTVAKNLMLPHVSLAGGYLTVVVAMFGTTISPYLFFWQAAEEVEDEKQDPSAKPLSKAPGASAGADGAHADRYTRRNGLLQHNRAFHHVDDGRDAERARRHGHSNLVPGRRSVAPDRRPIRVHDLRARHHRHRTAAVPVLAGSAAYAVGEALKWRVGLAQRPGRAPAFYGTIAAGDVNRRECSISPRSIR